MKKLLLLFSALALVTSLSACGLFGGDVDDPDPDPEITGLAINGLVDQTYEEDTTVDLLDGVTVTAVGGLDFTAELTVDSDDCFINANNTLTGADPKTCTIDYTVVVSGIYLTDSITITFTKKEVVIGDDLPTVIEWNWEDAAELTGWSIYTASTGSVDMSVEDGAMKLITTSGAQRFETRIDYQGLPLENGYPYKISFRAKSDIDGKKIHFNFGELIASDPWFRPFKAENVDIITLSTDWQEFEITFMMETENINGGPVIEMGNLPDSEGLDATIWFDWLKIEGGTGTDALAPVIAGATDEILYVGDQTTFDLLAGVTATDLVDGDVTADIVLGGDTLNVNTAGVYEVTYTVTDEAGNVGTVTRTITVLVDTEGPVLSGLDEAEIEVGGTFDPLAGVTAVDGRDGDVTADIVVTGEYDVDVTGIYTLTYTVADALGNETVETRVLKVEDKVWVGTDLVENGMMNTYWYLWNADWNATSVSVDFDGAAAILDIVDPGVENWNIQFNQDNLVLTAGQQYVATLNASSTVEREINVKLIAGGAEYFETITLTPTSTEFMVVFAYTGGDVTDGKLSLEMGGLGGDASITVAPASVVTLEDVMIEEYDGTAAVAETNVIMDPSFEATGPFGWGFWCDGAITCSLDAMDGAAVLTYDAYGTEKWHIKAEQGGFEFVEGATYRLVFDAKGDAARDFFAGFWNGSENTEMEFALTDEWQTFIFEFVYTSSAGATLEFKLGAPTTAAGTMFYLDNVSILRGYAKSDFYEEDAGLINNGTMETAWYLWNADWNATSVTVDFDGSSAVLDIVDPGVENWNIQLNQENLVLTAGQQYVATLNASSTVEREINVKLIAGGAEYFETITLTPTSTEFMVVFAYTGGDVTDGKLSLEMGGLGGDASITVAPASVVTIEDVMIEEYDGTAAVAETNVILDPSFEATGPLGWGFWCDGAITCSLDAMDGAAVLTYDAYGSEVWHIKAEQGGIVFEEGATYKLSFRAKGDAARDFFAGFWNGSENFEQQFDLTTEWQTFEFEFVYTSAAGATLEFKLGNPTLQAGTMFYLDDVIITQTYLIEDMNFVATDVLDNGAFDALQWYVWNADWNATSVTATFDGSSAVLDIADPGVENWNIQLNQDNLVLTAGQQYIATLTASSTVDRDINVKLIAGGAEYFETITLTPTSTEYTVVFVYTGGDVTDGKLSLEMGGLGGDASITLAPASVVTVEDVMIEEYDGTAAVAETNVLLNPSFENLNDAGWGHWCDGAVTCSLVPMDGGVVMSYDSFGSAVYHVKVEQTGVELVAGETYKLTFKAKGDLARDIEVGFWDGGAGQVTMFDITTEYDFFTWVFVYDIGSPATLEFKLGTTANAAGTMFYLDDVVIEMLETE